MQKQPRYQPRYQPLIFSEARPKQWQVKAKRILIKHVDVITGAITVARLFVQLGQSVEDLRSKLRSGFKSVRLFLPNIKNRDLLTDSRNTWYVYGASRSAAGLLQHERVENSHVTHAYLNSLEHIIAQMEEFIEPPWLHDMIATAMAGEVDRFSVALDHVMKYRQRAGVHAHLTKTIENGIRATLQAACLRGSIDCFKKLEQRLCSDLANVKPCKHHQHRSKFCFSRILHRLDVSWKSLLREALHGQGRESVSMARYLWEHVEFPRSAYIRQQDYLGVMLDSAAVGNCVSFRFVFEHILATCNAKSLRVMWQSPAFQKIVVERRIAERLLLRDFATCAQYLMSKQYTYLDQPAFWTPREMQVNMTSLFCTKFDSKQQTQLFACMIMELLFADQDPALMFDFLLCRAPHLVASVVRNLELEVVGEAVYNSIRRGNLQKLIAIKQLINAAAVYTKEQIQQEVEDVAAEQEKRKRKTVGQWMLKERFCTGLMSRCVVKSVCQEADIFGFYTLLRNCHVAESIALWFTMGSCSASIPCIFVEQDLIEVRNLVNSVLENQASYRSDLTENLVILPIELISLLISFAPCEIGPACLVPLLSTMTEAEWKQFATVLGSTQPSAIH